MNDLVDIFENANKKFLSNSLSLLNDDVSERTLCGTLGQYLDYETKHSKYNCYYVDTEYNRNAGRVKTFYKDKETIVPINCDLIVHSRGEIPERDNLIAIEMKKSYRSCSDKESDRIRLIALTKVSYDGVWKYDGNLPEHVCGYGLGVYYEINKQRKTIYTEYYMLGELTDTKEMSWIKI